MLHGNVTVCLLDLGVHLLEVGAMWMLVFCGSLISSRSSRERWPVCSLMVFSGTLAIVALRL